MIMRHLHATRGTWSARAPCVVIPAQAGIPLQSLEAGQGQVKGWVPACAGTTRILFLLRGRGVSSAAGRLVPLDGPAA